MRSAAHFMTRSLGATLAVGILCAVPALADGHSESEDFDKVIVPITKVRIGPDLHAGFKGKPDKNISIKISAGTGFCLDSNCRFVVTNFHVAKTALPSKIKHQKIVQRYFATGTTDKQAAFHSIPGQDELLAFSDSRDLALLELKQPLRGYHGVKFSIDDLESREEVDIYSFPYESFSFDIRHFRKLTHVKAKFNAWTTSGLLAFDCQSSDDQTIHLAHGSSGGVVVNKSGRIVGILSQVNGTMALAVPSRNLMDFVSKVQPFLAIEVFPAFKAPIAETVDIYPPFKRREDSNSKLEVSHAGALVQRPVEPTDVKALRSQAQKLADNMRNYIAVQSFDWGQGEKPPEARALYQVRVVDGRQTFLPFPRGGKETAEVDFPKTNGWVLGADEWSGLPYMLGSAYNLHIRRADDIEIVDQKFSVFQYRADNEDELCPFAPVEDFGFFKRSKVVQVACYGEAWVDKDGNIRRISENLDLSDKRKEYRGWTAYRIVVTYGFYEIENQPDQLLPLTTLTEGHFGKKVFWCHGLFSNYEMFGSKSRLIAASETHQAYGQASADTPKSPN